MSRCSFRARLRPLIAQRSRPNTAPAHPYSALPVTITTENPQSIASTLASAAPMTEQHPFTAHAHDTSGAEILPSPSGNIIPIKNASGASNATVSFATSDDAGTQNCNVMFGKASSRCDYIPVNGTVQFAPGEMAASPVLREQLLV